MSRWRRAFNQIGGPDVVTWPVFWISFVASVLGNFTTGGAVDAGLWVRLGVLTITQVAMFVPLVALRLTVLRDPPRPRPWVGLAGIATACIVRGVTLSYLLVAVGGVEEPLLIYRVVASFNSQALLLIVVAMALGTLRTNSRSLAELVRVQRELEATQELILAGVTQRNEEALAGVRERLRSELTALDTMAGAESVAELQRLASDVVRPMSHDLAYSIPASAPHVGEVPNEHVTWRQAVSEMALHSPFRPLPAGVVLGVMLITASLGLWGIRGFMLALAVFASVVVWASLANAALRRVLPRMGQGPALAVIVVTSLVVGCLVTAPAFWLLPSRDVLGIFICGGVVMSAGILLLSALFSATMRQQAQAEVRLGQRTEALRSELVRLRQIRWLQQKGLSRALHGPVQAAVTAAALRLDAALHRGEATDHLLDDIRTDLRSVIDVLEVPEGQAASFDLALARIAGTWDSVCEVTYRLPDSARQALEGDRVTEVIVVDLLTEAVSNAVRHGGAEHALVTFDLPEVGRLNLTISDDGRGGGPGTASTGLGTALLDDCTLAWERRVETTGTDLAITLPISSVS